AAAWATTARTAWLVGQRGDDGTLRPVLGADVEAAWARSLRRRVLRLLDSVPEGTAVTPTWVRAVLTFARPRRPVPKGAVTAVLAEAELLGLTGGGALSRAGRLLAGSLSEAETGAAAEERLMEEDGLLSRLEEAFAADLPRPVDMLLVQSDLTAIVPGRPAPALAAVLERCAEVESRGGALTVRFTADSVRGALDAGCSGDELIEELGAHCPTPLPSALKVLVEDAVRRHGAVRVREAVSILRVGDPVVAAGIVADPRLTGLALAEVGPGVLAS
ncbi:helicase C-terminal domain protein, partial [Actinomyces massiliensis F0489]